ncbi:hypothetical protein BSZ35_11085 [Salinibacter sp. 10B]|uniref:sulfotransferase domain-containing protein n=1 Tax=Salinibacter sp. 10B TaxID=1923971 RepID=UPI000CF3A84A|nr:sulfotransferase domain-containing protein [Salinibacter sp. 10B]PQJ35065.1 hypothetical protein BSZ35_11085 [Salinibacter sp. 10B]
MIIGAEKAGTTALSQFLRQHPDVCFSLPKETWFFNRRYHKGIDWFASHFEHWDGETAIGEGTARLLQSEEAPARIVNHIPDVQLICLLRNPIDRAFSQYHFYLYTGRADPDQSFGELVREQNTEFGRDLVNQGRYINHLRRYERTFRRAQIEVVLHRDLRRHPKKVVQHLYETIGVDASFVPDVESRHNVTKYPTSRTVYATLRNAWQIVFSRAETYFPDAIDTLRSFARRVLFDTSKPSMAEEDRAYLQQVYEDPNRELERWLGKDLSHWK